MHAISYSRQIPVSKFQQYHPWNVFLCNHLKLIQKSKLVPLIKDTYLFDAHIFDILKTLFESNVA